MRVLIIEDEPYMAEAIRDGLRLEAIAADIAGDGDAALELLSINAYDIAVLDRDIPGPSGDKVAERIVTELKDKAPAYTDVDPALVALSGALDERRAPQPISDAVSALVNLGYAQPQAAAAIAAAVRNAGDSAEVRTLIRLGLKELAK